jgi:hypothetical protein
MPMNAAPQLPCAPDYARSQESLVPVMLRVREGRVIGIENPASEGVLGELVTGSFENGVLNVGNHALSAYGSARSLIERRQAAGLPTVITAFSDSTGGNTLTGGAEGGVLRFIRRFCSTLAEWFPTARIRSRYWDDTAPGWPPLTTIRAGGGADIIVNIGFVSGTRLEYMAGSRWRALMSQQPQIVILNHGHNYATSTWPSLDSIAAAMSATVEQISNAAPDAVMLFVAQAPGASMANAPKADAVRRYAREIGAPCADGASAFVAAGNAAGLYLDGTHQTDAGDLLLTNVLADAFMVPAVPVLSALAARSLCVNSNGLLGVGAPNAVPTGYIGSNIAIADTTDPTYHETGARALRLSRAANGAPSYMYYNVSGPELNAILGQPVSWCVRQFVPGSAPAGAGRIAIEPRNSSGIISSAKVTSAASVEGRGGIRWFSQAAIIPDDATSVRLYIYADASNSIDASETYVDRAGLVLGARVRDFV